MAIIDLALSGSYDAIRIEPVLIFRRNDAFENAPDVVVQQAGLFFESIKGEIANSVRGKMREWHGEERRDVTAAIYPGIYNQVSLIIGGDLAQTFIDEFGLPRGEGIQPHGAGSLLFQWVVEKLAPQPLPVARPRKGDDQRLLSAQLSVSYAVALAINQRGLPAPADYLHQPFRSTFEEFLPRVMEGLVNAGIRAANIINTSDAGTVEFVVKG